MPFLLKRYSTRFLGWWLTGNVRLAGYVRLTGERDWYVPLLVLIEDDVSRGHYFMGVEVHHPVSGGRQIIKANEHTVNTPILKGTKVRPSIMQRAEGSYSSDVAKVRWVPTQGLIWGNVLSVWSWCEAMQVSVGVTQFLPHIVRDECASAYGAYVFHDMLILNLNPPTILWLVSGIKVGCEAHTSVTIVYYQLVLELLGIITHQSYRVPSRWNAHLGLEGLDPSF
jgi:hypothetical protein